MFKKTLTAALAAVTLFTAVAASTSESQARPRYGAAIGIGLVAGALIGAAAASNAYGADYGYRIADRECGYIKRYDRFGRPHYEKVCSYAEY
ncbi:hypothetical protein [Pseudolabrys sp. FHR47]|uniref:hypothetical protein n=1 Tax=Pseudolabrys sp. FHR47 TaxID=2562284 RepID=UPI0010BE567D|nr:hypothetical protein [Pseudolabrys sp. FHR47]